MMMESKMGLDDDGERLQEDLYNHISTNVH